MKALILAGGRGSRLKDLTNDIQKCMIEIGGKPILEHQINLLKKYGFVDIVILTGYKSEIIERYFKDGCNFGVKISYSIENKPLGTAGGIKEIENILVEDFIVLYGDVMLNMNLKKLVDFHKKSDGLSTLVLHPNNHPYDSDLVEIDSTKRIVAFHPKPHDENRYYKNLVTAGVYICNVKILDYIKKGANADFGKNIFPDIIPKERLYGYVSAEYLKDMGNPQRLREVEEDYRSGKIASLNSDTKKHAIFLDRDGAINKEVGLLCKIGDFELLPGAAKAIRKINDAKFLAIVVTNQSVVARNLCSIAELEEIHKKMETLLGQENAYLDAIYYCPHHPDKGFPEENQEYKIDCDCRKPKTGLIKQAENNYNIDLKNSFMIGDSARDILCGKAAGLRTIALRTGYGCKDGAVEPDYFFDNLNDAINSIINEPHYDRDTK